MNFLQIKNIYFSIPCDWRKKYCTFTLAIENEDEFFIRKLFSISNSLKPTVADSESRVNAPTFLYTVSENSLFSEL